MRVRTKAQMFSTDLIIALLTFTFILISVAWVWDFSREKMVLSEKRTNMNLVSDFAISALIESEGNPTNWNELTNRSSIGAIGLAKSPWELSPQKIHKLNTLSETNYEALKGMLALRGPNYEFVIKMEKQGGLLVTGFFAGDRIAYTYADGDILESTKTNYGILDYLIINNITLTDYEDDWQSLLADINQYNVVIFEDPQLDVSDLSALQQTQLGNWVAAGGVFFQKQYGQVIELFNVTAILADNENGNLIHKDNMFENVDIGDQVFILEGYRIVNQTGLQILVAHGSGDMLIGHWDYGLGQVYYLPDTEGEVRDVNGSSKYNNVRFMLNLPEKKNPLYIGIYPDSTASNIVITKRLAAIDINVVNITLYLWERTGDAIESYCDQGEYLILGMDETVACCSNPDDYVIDEMCFSCPADKPTLYFTRTFTNDNNTIEILLGGVESPFVNQDAKVVVPCQSLIVKTDLDIYNDKEYIIANESIIPNSSTIILTDVSGSMNWRFDSSVFGTNRNCQNDLLFDITTRRIALARCLQTGIQNSGTDFDGITSALITENAGNLVGLAIFESSGSIVNFLSNNIIQLDNAVSAYGAGGSTNIEGGLEESVTILETANPNEFNYIILISDGKEWIGDSDDYVCNGAFPKENITVFPLGIGPSYFFDPGYEGDCNYAGDPVACQTLENIANCTGGIAYNAMSPAGAVDMLQEIIGFILEPVYPSSLNISGLLYNGVFNGTPQNPTYLIPKPDITLPVQNAANSCPTGPFDFSIRIESTSEGYLTLTNLEVAACAP